MIYKIARFIHHFKRAINIPFITKHFCYSFPISNEILRRSKVLEGELSSTGWDEAREYNRATERIVEKRCVRRAGWISEKHEIATITPCPQGERYLHWNASRLALAVAAESPRGPRGTICRMSWRRTRKGEGADGVPPRKRAGPKSPGGTSFPVTSLSRGINERDVDARDPVIVPFKDLACAFVISRWREDAIAQGIRRGEREKRKERNVPRHFS